MRYQAMHASFHYQKVTLQGRATEDAVYGQRYQLTFSMSNVEAVAPRHAALVGNVTVRGFGESAVYRGDLVRVTGKLYPTRGNNLASVSFAQLRVIERGSSKIDEVRRLFAAGMQSALPEPAASFGLGLLLGQRSTLPEHTQEELRHTGLTHIIAVSGYNLTIIVMACRRLFMNHSKFQATAACLLLIGVFLLMTGSSPPIVRASIISVLSIAVWYYGRAFKPVVLLLLAAAATVLMNPFYLWGNVSWYLSFLAFFGVLVLAPLVTRRLWDNKEPKVLAGILVESACASVAVLPYILYIFGEVSLVSLLANLCVIPFIPFAMLLALVAGLAGVLAPALASWLAWPANMLLTYMLDVASILSRVPHAFIERIGFSLPAMLVGYAVLVLLCAVLWLKTRQKHGIITDKKATVSKGVRMSGHSKWSTIKREKGAKDAARGAVFTKLGNAIAIAARAGTDPTTNFALRLAIDKAKAANMPLANIDRAIQRVADKNAAQLQEIMYEGYGPGGVAILVECATDNSNRTYPEVRLAFSKHGGNIAEKGAVAFQFDQKGMIRVKGTGDDLLMQALEAGAEDMQEETEESVIYTDPKELAKVRDALREQGIEITEAELTFVPNVTVEVADKETAGKIMRLMNALEDCDDVTNTHVNFDIAPELL